jgi:hypothetical protein
VLEGAMRSVVVLNNIHFTYAHLKKIIIYKKYASVSFAFDLKSQVEK